MVELHGLFLLQQFDVQILGYKISFLIAKRCTEIWVRCFKDLSIMESRLWWSCTALVEGIFCSVEPFPENDPVSFICLKLLISLSGYKLFHKKESKLYFTSIKRFKLYFQWIKSLNLTTVAAPWALNHLQNLKNLHVKRELVVEACRNCGWVVIGLTICL